jgi:hypothetical protein
LKSEGNLKSKQNFKSEQNLKSEERKKRKQKKGEEKKNTFALRVGLWAWPIAQNLKQTPFVGCAARG